MISQLGFLLPDPEHSAAARVLLTLGYLAAARCWFRAGGQTQAADETASRRWWKLGAFLLLLLAANKAFDFRAQSETLIRMFAKATGWYERRQPVQFVLAIVLPVVAALGILGLALTKARQFVRQHPVAPAGWFLLFLYLALRQSQEWKPALNWLAAIHYYQWRFGLEASGILLVLSATFPAGKKSAL